MSLQSSQPLWNVSAIDVRSYYTHEVRNEEGYAKFIPINVVTHLRNVLEVLAHVVLKFHFYNKVVSVYIFCDSLSRQV